MRVRTVLVGVLVLGWVSWPVGSLVYRLLADDAPAPVARKVPSFSMAEPGEKLSWTVEDAVAAVDDGPLARLPGAPAVLDEDRVRAALADTDTDTTVLLLPHSGVDTRDQHDDQVSRLFDTLDAEEEVVVVSGLRVHTSSMVTAVPSDMPEAEHVLRTRDVTSLVLTAIRRESVDAPDLPPARAPDPAQVDAIAGDLAAEQVHTAPGIESVTDTTRFDDIIPGVTVRIAALPADQPGQPRTDLAGALSARFPGDLIVVVRGLWVEFAGVDEDLRRTALNGFYGLRYGSVAKWGPAPVNLALVVVREYATLSANRDAVFAPRRQADPLPIVLTWLPWVFAGTVAVVVGSTLLARRRRAERGRALEQAARVERDRLAGTLTAVAGRITHLDGLARGGRAGQLVDRATERYRTARDVLADAGDLRTARDALRDADTDLAAAAELLAVRTGARGERTE